MRRLPVPNDRCASKRIAIAAGSTAISDPENPSVTGSPPTGTAMVPRSYSTHPARPVPNETVALVTRPTACVFDPQMIRPAIESVATVFCTRTNTRYTPRLSTPVPDGHTPDARCVIVVAVANVQTSRFPFDAVASADDVVSVPAVIDSACNANVTFDGVPRRRTPMTARRDTVVAVTGV